MSIEWIGDFKAPSGYGRACRADLRALIKAGVTPAVRIHQHDRTQMDLSKDAFWGLRVADLLSPQREHPDIVVWQETPEFYRPDPTCKNVARIEWETSKIVDYDHADDPTHNWVAQLNAMSEVWTASTFVADVLTSSGVTTPSHVIPHPTDLETFCPGERRYIGGPPGKEANRGRFTALALFQWCYDDQTRVLTKDGFKYFKDVTTDDLVATIDPSTSVMTYQHPRKVVKFRRKDKMLLIGGKHGHTDLCVTPDHRMLYREKAESEWKLAPANTLLSKTRRDLGFRFGIHAKKDCVWKGEGADYFYPPQVEQRQGRNTSVHKIAIRPFLRLLGWYLSEGCYQFAERGYRIEIRQRKRLHYREDIVRAVKDCGFRPVRGGGDGSLIIFYSKQMCHYFEQFGRAPKKFVPGWVKDLSPDLLTEFLVPLFKGDGSSYNDVSKPANWIKYASTSKRLAYDVLECLLKIGLSGAVSKGSRAGKDTSGYKHRDGFNPDNYHDLYTVSVNRTQKQPEMAYWHLEEIDYDGYVYCAEMPPHGNMLVERHGKVVWSGNTARKAPEDLLTAWSRSTLGKREDCCLLLKTYGADFTDVTRIVQHISVFRQMLNIPGLVTNVYPITSLILEKDMPDMYRTADVFLSPSRGEGHNLPVAESMACGVPAIYTNKTAHSEYAIGYPVKYHAVPVTGMPHIPWYSAEQDWWQIDALDFVARLEEAYADWKTGRLKELGVEARSQAEALHSDERVGSLLRERCEALSPQAV